MRFATILAAAVVLAGCMTMGREFRVTQVPMIELGRTTAEDLRKLFGEPYRSGMDDGDFTETWIHYKFRLFGEQQTRDLYVRYDKSGVVKSYSLNSNFPDDQERLKKIAGR